MLPLEMEPSMAKRPRSEAQRAASRANGRRSSGPKTAEGKGRSRRNALRHGLRAIALDVLLPAANQPVAGLVESVRQRLAPRDAIEHEFADGIAMAFWRLRRARRLEEALLAGGDVEHGETGLAKAFFRRNDGAGAMPLLLRYRNQALAELNRFFALLEAHRRLPAGTVDLDAGAAPLSQPNATPANDNRTADDAGTAAPFEPPVS
jgi:hypothetical protein